MTAPGPVDITLIVCTRDRPGAVDACLGSIESALAFSGDLNIDLIVVDNSATQSAETILRTWRTRLGDLLTVLNVSRPGLSRARNAAIRNARGAIIAFTDDDCRLDRNYFRAVSGVVADLARPSLVGGKVERGSPDDAEFTTREGDHPERFTNRTVAGGFVLGCNLVIDRRVIEVVGYFDEDFGVGARFRSGEDTDYVIRVHLAGFPVHYSPRFAVRHHHGRSSRAAIIPVHNSYSFGNGALYAKHWTAAPWLRRQFVWLLKGCVREAISRRQFDDANRLSHFPVLMQSLRGFSKYTFEWLTKPKVDRIARGSSSSRCDMRL